MFGPSKICADKNNNPTPYEIGDNSEIMSVAYGLNFILFYEKVKKKKKNYF